MSLPVVIIIKDMKESNQIKKNIGVYYVMKEHFIEMYYITRGGGGRIRMTRKEVLRCVQTVVVKNKFLVKFRYGHMREIGSSLLLHVCSK